MPRGYEAIQQVHCQGAAGDAQAVCDFIVERLEWATAKLQRYERFRARLLDGRGEDEYLAQTQRVGPHLTLLRGFSFEQENIRWPSGC